MTIPCPGVLEAGIWDHGMAGPELSSQPTDELPQPHLPSLMFTVQCSALSPTPTPSALAFLLILECNLLQAEPPFARYRALRIGAYRIVMLEDLASRCFEKGLKPSAWESLSFLLPQLSFSLCSPPQRGSSLRGDTITPTSPYT